MNLANVLKIINEMQSEINGNCKIYICSMGTECLKFIVDWTEGFRINHAVDISGLESANEEVLCFMIVQRCNEAYKAEMEKKLKKTPVVSIDELYVTRRNHNES